MIYAILKRKMFVYICITTLFVYALGVTFYNRYVHPLRHYPGPFTASISRLPYAFNYITGGLHLHIQSLHNEYGDVVRVAPDELSFQTESAWRDICGFATNFPKDPKFYNIAKNGASNLAVAPTDEIHRRQRRVLGHAFSETTLRNQEKLLQTYVDTLISRLEDKARTDAPVDLAAWYNYTTFDFMAHYVFGSSLSCLDGSAYHPWVAMIFNSVRAWAFISLAKYIPSLSYVIKGLVMIIHRDLLKSRQASFDLVVNRLAERIERKEQPSVPDFMTHVQSTAYSQQTLSDDEVRSNASFLMIAGSETTATWLSGTTFFLLKNPDVLEELTSQIRSRYQNSDDITFASLKDFPLLYAVLQETLRMYPPTPLGMPRVVPKGGAIVAGRLVPEKTSVAIPHYATYRSSAKFHQAGTFVPQRWMKDCGEEYSNDQRELVQPFSFGPRACLGKSLAYAESRLILTKVLWTFDLHLCAESREWSNQRAFVVWDKKPLMARFVARLGSSAITAG